MAVAIKQETATTRATSYTEAYEQFAGWRPKMLQREGANGMVFDYLPVQDYENYLDTVVGPENWQTFMESSAKAVTVRLVIFGVSKASTSDIWPAAKIKNKKTGDYRENPQPNEVNKAEARAFRRAAAKHGLLRHVWEKDSGSDSEEEDERPVRRSSFQSKSSGKSSGGSGLASEGQVSWLSKSVERGGFGVPRAVAEKLTGGKGGQASALIDALKKASGEGDYEDDPTPYIAQALKKIAPKLVAMLDEVDVEDDEDDDDED